MADARWFSSGDTLDHLASSIPCFVHGVRMDLRIASKSEVLRETRTKLWTSALGAMKASAASTSCIRCWLPPSRLLLGARTTPRHHLAISEFASPERKARLPRLCWSLIICGWQQASMATPQPTFGFHTLRRTLASVMVKMKADVKIVQEMWHKDLTTILEIYDGSMIWSA